MFNCVLGAGGGRLGFAAVVVVVVVVVGLIISTSSTSTSSVWVMFKRKEIDNDQNPRVGFQALAQPLDGQRRVLEVVETQAYGRHVEVVELGPLEVVGGDFGAYEVADDGVGLVLREARGARGFVVVRHHVLADVDPADGGDEAAKGFCYGPGAAGVVEEADFSSWS